MDRIGSVVEGRETGAAEEILRVERDRLRTALREVTPFRAGSIVRRCAERNPLTGRSEELLCVAPFSDEAVYRFRLEGLLSTEPSAPLSDAEATLRWSALGPAGPVDPWLLLFCARHGARLYCQYYPADSGDDPRIAALPEAASLSEALSLAGAPGVEAVHAASRGRIVWGEDVELCANRARVLSKPVAYTGPPSPAPDPSTAPTLRGLFGRGRPVVCVRAATPDDERLASSQEAKRGEGVSPLPVRVVRPGSEPEPPDELDGETPVVAVVPGEGAWALHRDAATARAAAALFARSLEEPSSASAWTIPPHVWASIAPDPVRPLTGKIALVTGGGSGIGLAIGRRLMAEGACVLLVGRSGEKLERGVASLREESDDARVAAAECDVCDPDAVDRAFNDVVTRWGGLDILVNCAGLSLSRSLEETTPEDYDRQNDVMPRGSFLCSRAAARIMRLQGTGGDIVYIASKNGLFAGPNNVAYGTAKAAQIHQARLLAAELAPLRVRVNVVNPDGVVRGSGIFEGAWGEDRARTYGVKLEDLGKHYASRSLLKDEILPEDVAAAVYVLVGPELRKSTGLVINVDGGFAPTMLR